MATLLLLALFAADAPFVPADRESRPDVYLTRGETKDEVLLVTPNRTYRRTPEPQTKVWDFALIPGTSTALVAVQSGHAYVLDLRAEEAPKRVLPSGRGFHTVAVSRGGLVALGDWSGNVYVLPVDGLDAGETAFPSPSPAKARRGRRAAHRPRYPVDDASRFGVVYIWSKKDSQWSDVYRYHCGYVTDMQFSADGKLLFSADQNGQFLVTEVNSRKVQYHRRLGESITQIAVKDRRVYVRTCGGALHEWDERKGLRLVEKGT